MSNAMRKLVTVEDWLNLYEDERCELIEGDIVYKSQPSSAHSCAQSAIVTHIKNEYQYKRKGSKGWWIMTEASVVYEGRPNGFTHDIAGWKKENYPEKPKGKKITERPDWVCEILSNNRKHDLNTKKWVLHEHKVPYYWIVDLESEMISILEWSEKGYITILDAKKEEKRILAPFDMEFDIAVFLGDDPE